LHDAGHQQRCLAGRAAQTTVKKVPLELLVNLIPCDLLLQSQRIGRVEFHAKAEQNIVHIWNTVAVADRTRFCRPASPPIRVRAYVLCAKEAQRLLRRFLHNFHYCKFIEFQTSNHLSNRHYKHASSFLSENPKKTLIDPIFILNLVDLWIGRFTFAP